MGSNPTVSTMTMTSFLRQWFKYNKPVEQPTVITPEIAFIIQELDDELAREHELLTDLNDAARDVSGLLRSFAQRCQSVMLVGSYRRGVPNPGDIDVLYIPKSTLQAMEFLEGVSDDEKLIEPLASGWRTVIRGKRVDFIQSTPARWGIDVLQFTGSREFNARVIRHAERRGYKIIDGLPIITKSNSYDSWKVCAFDFWSEAKILEHLGLLAYLDPRTREPDRTAITTTTSETKSITLDT